MTGHIEIPDDLCPVHHESAVTWRNNHYTPHNPGEWPAGLSVPGARGVMDSRTTHDERRREFERKNREQVELITRICRSGRSSECGSLDAERTSS